MSANNWARCPRCTRRHHDALDDEQARVNDAYGKVPVAEFDEMRAGLSTKRQAGLDSTFREDWEIGLDEAEFYVIYRGGCTSCGLTKEFRHSEVLPTDGAA